MMRYRRLSYGYALLVSSAQPDSAVRLAPTTWCPSADVYETRDEIHVTVELAGVALDEIDPVSYTTSDAADD
jgi:HSP20 family molecular chaperone IbpA